MASPTDQIQSNHFDIENPPSQDLQNQSGFHGAVDTSLSSPPLDMENPRLRFLENPGSLGHLLSSYRGGIVDFPSYFLFYCLTLIHRRAWERAMFQFDRQHFNRRAFSLNQRHATTSNPRYLPSSVVNILNITQLVPNSTRVEGQPLSNRPSLKETFLAISAQSALTVLTVWNSGNNSLSKKKIIQFYIAAGFNVFGFLSLLFAILISGRKPRMTRILTGTGIVFAAYGFIANMGMLLSDNIMFWVTGLACLASFPPLASSFIYT